MSLVQTRDPLEFSAYLVTPRHRRVLPERKAPAPLKRQLPPFDLCALLVVFSYIQSGAISFGAKPRMRDILDKIAKKHGLDPEVIKGPSRRALIVWARKEAVYYMRTETGHKFESIGRFMGGRDRTTVMYAAQQFAKQHDLPQTWARDKRT